MQPSSSVCSQTIPSVSCVPIPKILQGGQGSRHGVYEYVSLRLILKVSFELEYAHNLALRV